MTQEHQIYPTSSNAALILLLFSLTMAGLAVLFYTTFQSQTQIAEASLNSKARAEVGLCIFSVNPTRRTPEYVMSCYDEVEKKLGVKVERYGDGIK